MYSESQWEKAIKKLLDLTHSRKLEWTTLELLERDGIQGHAYVAAVQDRFIAVYEFQYKSYHDEDSWEWDNEVAIEFVDNNFNLEWRWPASPLRWRLLDEIRFQSSHASDFIEKFLEEA